MRSLIPYFFSVLIFSATCSKAQLPPESLKIINTLDSKIEPTLTRPFMNLKGKKLIKKLNPLLFLSAGGLFIYQNLFSEQIQASCIYEISCSENMKRQISTAGFRGFLLGIFQFNTCSPDIIIDYPGYMINKNGKIKNIL